MFRRLMAMIPLVAALSAPALAGEAASDFTLRDIDNQNVTLSDLEGNVVILSFWATWCGPCKEEMPHLQTLQDERGKDGLKVLSISTDDARTASQVKPYIKRNGYTFTVLLDRSSEVLSSWNPGKQLPFTVVLDRDLEVAKKIAGYNPGDEEELRELVDGLLEAPAGDESEDASTDESSEG